MTKGGTARMETSFAGVLVNLKFPNPKDLSFTLKFFGLFEDPFEAKRKLLRNTPKVIRRASKHFSFHFERVFE